MKHLPRSLAIVVVLGLLGSIVRPVTGQAPGEQSTEPSLPTEMININIDSPDSQAYRIGVPDLLGATPQNHDAATIVRNDFSLMPGYRVVDPASIRHDTVAEGLAIQAGAWSALDARGVIKGEVRSDGDRLIVEMRFFRVDSPRSAALSRTYRGHPERLREWMHEFGNEVLQTITGVLGPFGTQITFARRERPGRKDVFTADMDGVNLRRVSNGQGIAMLPAFGPRNIWYTRLTDTGSFITNNGSNDRRIIGGSGLNMSPSICDGRVYFTSSRDGNSEIYSAALDGTDLRRLTRHPSIDVSPACGPTGQVAFISNRHGSPQVFVMNRDGTDPRRITFRGNHNQTPAWCPNAHNPVIAFTGRDAGLDIFTVRLDTQEYTRLTQAQGANKDPAFSPDCRIVAFVSERRSGTGVYLSSPQGFNQQLVIPGQAETVRWATRATTNRRAD